MARTGTSRAALLAHLPVLTGLGLLLHSGGVLLWGQLGVMAGLAVVGRVASSQVGRASATGLGLMVGADVLVHVGGGLTDLHIWFYALLALVALYQNWTPFLIAVGFVAVKYLPASA